VKTHKNDIRKGDYVQVDKQHFNNILCQVIDVRNKELIVKKYGIFHTVSKNICKKVEVEEDE